MNEKITFPDGLGGEGAFWNGGTFGKEKAGDSYTYAVKTGYLALITHFGS